MKIKAIEIENYGPIKSFAFHPENFTLVFGLNESGKTAIVEALTYLLFKKSSVSLRYGKPNNINIEIADKDRMYTLPSKKVNIEFPSGDVANLLYVQASESSVYGYKGESSFWDGIKTMLGKVGKGIPFTKLDEDIFEAVGMQPKRVEWKREKQNLIQSEERRKDELWSYLKKIGEIEKKEIELAHLSEKNESIKKKLKEIENFKNYRRYRELRNVYNTYLEQKSCMQEYERYKHEYLATWQELDAKKKSRTDDEMKLVEVREEIQALEKEIDELKSHEEIIEREGFKTFITKATQEVRETSILYPLMTFSAATVLFILSLLNKIPLLPATGIFVVSLVLLIIFLARKQIARKILAERDVRLTKAKKFFPDISSLAELADRIEKTQEVKIKKETLLDEKRKIVTHLSSGETLQRIHDAIAELREKTGLAELSDLQEKLDKKRTVDEELSTSRGKIFGMLHEKDERKWERMIQEMKTSRPEQEPDISSEQDLKAERENIQESIEELMREIKIFKEVQKTRFNITDDRSAFIEYNQLEKNLENYEREREAALAARDIFRKMSGEMDEFIQEIMRGDQSLSEYFQLVTERYEKVEVKNKNFVVTDRDGITFKIEALSSGAQDQLLLCFRLAALKRMYPEGTFLILDDAFIFADWNRRTILVKLLKKFIEDGNQVIYLTSDDHTRDLFKECGARVVRI